MQKPSRIRRSGIDLVVMGLDCAKNEILIPFLMMGERYLLVPIMIDEEICVVSPISAKAVAPVIK